MSSGHICQAAKAFRITQFLHAPPEELTGYFKVNFAGHPGSLVAHCENAETTVITSEIATARGDRIWLAKRRHSRGRGNPVAKD